MPQMDVELILARQLASYLVMPIFLVDPHGCLIYYNEPAEAILGHRFEETGAMPIETWSTIFDAVDEEDAPLPPDSLPLVTALRERRAVHNGFCIHALDGVRRCIEVTAVPIIGQAGRMLGAMAIFWETRDGDPVLGNARLTGDTRT